MRRSYTSAIEAGLAKHYRTLEQEIMSDIVRRIKKAGKITSTADWQLNRLIFLGKSSEDLKKLVASAVQFDDAEVEKLYQAVIEEEYTVYRKQYEEITKEFIPYSENLWLQQITEAMIRQTKGDLINITRSMGFMLKKGAYTPLSAIYDDYLDQAIVDITSGAFDYNTVIRRVVGEMTRSGLRTDHAFSTNPTDYTGIDYPSGWHNRIDVAARRAILTGVSQLTDQITRKNAEILGVDRFEVSWHVGARPEHAEWQGKVYTMDQLEDICGLGTGAGLLGWNCRHSYYLFFPGSERQYTDEWLEEQREAEAVKQSFRGREYNTYEATQKQRRMETNMRAQRSKVRLLEEGEADPDDIVIAKCKYQAQLDEYKEFSRRFRLPEQKERIYADLKGRVAPSRQNYEKWRTGYFTKSAKEERDREHIQELAGNLIEKAKKTEPRITADLKDAVSGGTGRLEGLEHRFKTETSLKRKIKNKAKSKNITEDEYAKQITDVLRYTNVSDDDHFTDDYFLVIESMKKKGYTLIEVNNTFASDGPYRGVNTVVMSKGRFRFELQFHTPQSLAVKEENHKMYEEQRDSSTPESRKLELKKIMKENAERIPAPERVDEIKDKG